ncbi:F0F1 ATP synthase subunit delta [Prevotella sp. OH937_COT-195]|uniref:F0F1 ATP synthase subunit delta n=1 Tax=Prevotella sp. OH937_COT-195 TaxID=2491051 RepID=UPI000F646CF5|nr:F0F1 ATP synthase subunit delta [Prevotella sp. OH937_COT-195]RRD00884.1 F0F1 ATP synthase subunit delta [Prevotella sp. OH937_COT-195]
MDIGVISIRYARALLKSSIQNGCDKNVYNDMAALTKSFVDVPKLRHTINNPTLNKETKKQLLITACGVDINPLTRNFVELVIKEGREMVMMFIASSYITLYRKQKNIIHGKLITATTVSPATEQRMRQIVQDKTNGTVEFLTEVNPEIIGGFILEYDTYRMDASVQSKLRDILKTLK